MSADTPATVLSESGGGSAKSTGPAGDTSTGLSEDDKRRLRLEEIFRSEVREEIEGGKTGKSWISKAINSPFFIFLMSTVVVGIVSWQYKDFQEQAAKRIATASDTRKMLFELKYRADLVKQELQGSWPKNLIHHNAFSLHHDPQFASCSTTCVGDRLLAQSWSVDTSTAILMRDVKAKVDNVEQIILKVAPNDNNQDVSPLSESEAAELRPASDALNAAIDKCIGAVNGTITAARDAAPPSANRVPTPQSISAAPTHLAGRTDAPSGNISAPALPKAADNPADAQSTAVVGRWKSVTNVWAIEIRQAGEKFEMLTAENAMGKYNPPLISAEFHSVGNQEFSGRHMWGIGSTGKWANDGGLMLRQVDKDRLFIRYVDSTYTGGWNFIRDR